MIETVTMDALRQEAYAAVWEQAFVDARGVLGVPASTDGRTWPGNWDVTAIDDALATAVSLVWRGDDLRVSGRYETSTRHFRVQSPSAFYGVEVHAHATPALSDGRAVVWEVTDPDGRVLVRAGIDLAEDVYHHAPAGSHLHHVVAAAGVVAKTRSLTRPAACVRLVHTEAAA